MELLSAQELHQLRDDAASFLSGSAYIERPTEVSDSQGGYTPTWGTIGTVPYRLEPYSVNVGRGENGESLPMATSAFILITPHNTDLRPVDKVKIGTLHYEVTDVRSPRTDEVTCRANLILLNVGGIA